MNGIDGVRPPTWFWIVAVLGLAWEGFGVFQYLTHVGVFPSSMEMSEAERSLMESSPTWVTGLFAIGVFAGALGVIGLLLRKSWARPLLYVSMVANRFLPPDRSYHFYRKHMPLAGGISNVNLAGSWAADYHPRPIRQYVRISPTGPMIPVAFTPTSLGDDLHLAMTYRRAVLPHDRARQMADGFLRRVSSLAAR